MRDKLTILAACAAFLLLNGTIPALAMKGGHGHGARHARVSRALRLAALEPSVANGAVVQRMVQSATSKSATMNLGLARTTNAADAAAFRIEQGLSFKALMARWEPLIKKASKKFGVPATWIREVMQIESGGRTMMSANLRIMSSENAVGLMQIQPGTYAEMRTQYGLGPDPFNPHDNIFAGAGYLRWLKSKYGYPVMFEAYDDGPGHLEQRITSRSLLPLETQNYVRNVLVALGDRNALPQAVGIGANGAGASPASNTASGALAPVAVTPTTQALSMNTTCAFTQVDGTPYTVDCLAVTNVRMPMFQTRSPGENTIITVGNSDVHLRDDERHVIQQVVAHGGRV